MSTKNKTETNNQTAKPNNITEKSTSMRKDEKSPDDKLKNLNQNQDNLIVISANDNSKKSEKKITNNSNISTYDNLKKEDLIIKMKEIEEKLKLEKEDKKKQIEAKNKELESKDKIIFSIGGTNKKLLNELDDLKKEVDDKLDKIGMKQLVEKEKELQKKKKELPYEQVLKVKEKELKNTMNLLDILRKDKENLQKNLEEKSDLKRMRALEDKLKEEENIISQLEVELKLSNKVKEEHNKCEIIRENYEKEKKTFLNEIKFYKEKHKEMMQKMKEDEEKQTKLHNYLTNIKKENINSEKAGSDLNLPNININSNNNSNIKSLNNNLGKSNELNLEKYWKLLDVADKNQNNTDGRILEKSPNGKDFVNRKLINKFDAKKKFSDRQKFSISLSNKAYKIEVDESVKNLFGKEEKDILLKLLPQSEVEKLEKKFELIQKTKVALEKKYLMESKLQNKKTTELEERLEYTNLHNKELEQRNKILGYQINEHKNENKIFGRKVNELNTNISSMKLTLKQKEEENKMLVLKVQELQKANENINYSNNNNNSSNNQNSIVEDNINNNEENNENEHMGEEGEEQEHYNDDNNEEEN